MKKTSPTLFNEVPVYNQTDSYVADIHDINNPSLLRRLGFLDELFHQNWSNIRLLTWSILSLIGLTITFVIPYLGGTNNDIIWASGVYVLSVFAAIYVLRQYVNHARHRIKQVSAGCLMTQAPYIQSQLITLDGIKVHCFQIKLCDGIYHLQTFTLYGKSDIRFSLDAATVNVEDDIITVENSQGESLVFIGNSNHTKRFIEQLKSLVDAFR